MGLSGSRYVWEGAPWHLLRAGSAVSKTGMKGDRGFWLCCWRDTRCHLARWGNEMGRG